MTAASRTARKAWLVSGVVGGLFLSFVMLLVVGTFLVAAKLTGGEGR